MGEFDDRVAMVTGAASGVGRASTPALAARDAPVVLAGVNTGEGGKTC